MALTEVLQFLRIHQHAELRIDSRAVQSGDIFIAIPGASADGRKFITQAINNGASAILYEPADWLDESDIPIASYAMQELRALLPQIACAYYGQPSNELALFAITGTNGKSSTAHYIAQFFKAMHVECGVMGTLGNGLYPHLNAASLTTSDCCTLQGTLKKFKEKAQFVALEVSSHALDQGRFDGTVVNTAIFTNLSQDHLDYHKDMEEYFAVKCRLFTDFNVKHCVINLDDTYGQRLAALLPKEVVTTYSLANPAADLFMQNNILHSPWGSGILQTKLIGAFNISNLLAAFASCALQGVAFAQLLEIAKTIQPVVGRMELVQTIPAKGPKVVVDYAHTPDALVKVLQALRAYKPKNLYCVFGCGGDRDRTKRPLMMQAVVANSDYCIITNDNPRTEDPKQIVQDMLGDMIAANNVTIELDRALAIEKTIIQACEQDIVLIAGKGHEDYQIIGTTKYPFSDQAIAKLALEKLHSGEQQYANNS